MISGSSGCNRIHHNGDNIHRVCNHNRRSSFRSGVPVPGHHRRRSGRNGDRVRIHHGIHRSEIPDLRHRQWSDHNGDRVRKAYLYQKLGRSFN